MTARTRLFNMRFSRDEWLRLQTIAERYGLTPTDVIRMLLKREADRVAATSSPRSDSPPPPQDNEPIRTRPPLAESSPPANTPA